VCDVRRHTAYVREHLACVLLSNALAWRQLGQSRDGWLRWLGHMADVESELGVAIYVHRHRLSVIADIAWHAARATN